MLDEGGKERGKGREEIEKESWEGKRREREEEREGERERRRKEGWLRFEDYCTIPRLTFSCHMQPFLFLSFTTIPCSFEVTLLYYGL